MNKGAVTVQIMHRARETGVKLDSDPAWYSGYWGENGAPLFYDAYL